ncbi:MAG: hypothetical protein JXB49_14265 [Bacteroidales bacterium]|nr:hypothetical protein [Bacteroidales bacterium]
MYAISKNKRKYSPTPIVRLTMGADGKQQEEIVLVVTNMKKAVGNKMAERIVRLLNDNLSSESGMASEYHSEK